jgi:hypothetical protein
MASIRTQSIRAAAAGVLSVAAIATFITPASAAQATAIHVTAAAHTAATGPNTNIQGTPAKWDPAKLTAPPVTGTCSATNYSFSIDNKTKKSQTISYKTGSSPKQTLATIKTGVKEGICASGSKGAAFKLYIKGATSVLSLTLS